MLKKIGLAVVAVVVVFCGVVAMRPATYTVTRTATLAASPEVVFPYTNDFHKWLEWSPWDKMEPTQQRMHSGPAAGVGAVYEWSGKEVGKGRMTLTESVPAQKVAIKLEFIEPFASTNSTVFTLAPAAGGTQVTWTMVGNNNFVGKAFGMFMDFDAMIGKDFEAGLASLKTLAEADQKKADEAKQAAEAAAAAAAPAETVATPAKP
jgi:hypothetical protein